MLAALALWPAVGIYEDGIAGVHLAMPAREVRALLGPPARVHRLPISGPGPTLVDWIYTRRRVTVEIIRSDHYASVYQVSTTNPFYRTRTGVHVGSAERVVRTVARYCRNDPYDGRRYCSNVNEGGVGGTFWVIRLGRAVSVTVAAPVF